MTLSPTSTLIVNERVVIPRKGKVKKGRIVAAPVVVEKKIVPPGVATQAPGVFALRRKSSYGPRPQFNAARGFVYFVQAGQFVKIGLSRQHVDGRVASMQGACPYEMKVLGVRQIQVRILGLAERVIHARFRAFHFRGEWFHLSDEILAYVKRRCHFMATPRAANKKPRHPRG